jgi:transcriptional regulator with XRE-family HTH domain
MPANNSDLNVSDAIGERLRHLRERLGLSQIEIAARLGVGQPVVSRIEGRADLLLSTIRSYLVALGSSLSIHAVLNSGAVFDLNDHGGVSSAESSNNRFPQSAPPRATGDVSRDVVFSIHPGHASKILTGDEDRRVASPVYGRIDARGSRFHLLYKPD